MSRFFHRLAIMANPNDPSDRRVLNQSTQEFYPRHGTDDVAALERVRADMVNPEGCVAELLEYQHGPCIGRTMVFYVDRECQHPAGAVLRNPSTDVIFCSLCYAERDDLYDSRFGPKWRKAT